MLLLVVSMAGPVLPDSPVKVTQGSLQVVVVADVSKSMAAEDYRDFMPPRNGVAPRAVPGPYGTRLEMVKKIIGDELMPALSGNQLGIVTFMGNGWDLVDLTDDYTYIRDSMRVSMKIGNAPGGGSDYAEGFKEALILFQQTPEKDKQKVIVLFSDGGFTGEEKNLQETIGKLQEQNIRVIILGIGGDEPQAIPLYDDSTGQQVGNIQRDGKTVTTNIDDAALTALSGKMGGEYIRIVPASTWTLSGQANSLARKRKLTRRKSMSTRLAAGMLLVFGLFLRGIAPARTRRRQDD